MTSPERRRRFPRQRSRGGSGDSTLPGARLLHEGQFEGWSVRLPVFLGRRPAEPVDHDLAGFYDRVLKATNRDLFRNGAWRLCECSGWPDNQSCQNILAWCWAKDNERALIVVNFAPAPAQARVRVPWDELRGAQWRLNDQLTGDVYDRDGTEMRDSGLYVNPTPWQSHMFHVRLCDRFRKDWAKAATVESRKPETARLEGIAEHFQARTTQPNP